MDVPKNESSVRPEDAPANVRTSDDALREVSATPSSYSRAEEFNMRMPTPPNIVVPPPVMSDTIVHQLSIGLPIHNPEPQYNVDFLKDADYAKLFGVQLSNWEYKMRRTAQPILPFLFVGPASAAKNTDFLREAGITMVYGVQPRRAYGAMLTQGGIRAAQELNIASATVEVNDPHELVSNFPITTRKINGHLAFMNQVAQTNPDKPIGPGKVLIFCESGNEKSAAIAAAWLMETFEGIDHLRAMQVLVSRRFCSNFDETMKGVLAAYNDLLRAKRDVQRDTASHDTVQTRWGFQNGGHREVSHHVGIKRGRRRGSEGPFENGGGSSIDHRYGDEEGDGMELDSERFEGRSQAPFR